MADYVTTGYWSASYAVEDPLIPEPQTLAEQVADAVFARIVEGGYSFDQIIRVMAAALAGPVSYTHLDVYKRQLLIRPELVSMPGSALNTCRRQWRLSPSSR